MGSKMSVNNGGAFGRHSEASPCLRFLLCCLLVSIFVILSPGSSAREIHGQLRTQPLFVFWAAHFYGKLTKSHRQHDNEEEQASLQKLADWQKQLRPETCPVPGCKSGPSQKAHAFYLNMDGKYLSDPVENHLIKTRPQCIAVIHFVEKIHATLMTAERF